MQLGAPISNSVDVPRSWHGDFDQAMNFYRQGREAEAEAACRRAMAQGLDDAQSHLFLARLC
jgi:hypothetical protein